jgi:hypothetical protein
LAIACGYQFDRNIVLVDPPHGSDSSENKPENPMHTATITSIPSSHHPTRRPLVASLTGGKRNVPSPRERTWAVYKPSPWWTAVAAFVASIAIHIAAVAVLETGKDGRLAALWENRVPAGEEIRPD